MTSFPVDCEPRPEPRLAAAAFLLHVVAAVLPWATRCLPLLAAALSLLALASLAATLGRLPGRHCRLHGLAWRGDGWRLRFAGEACAVPARTGPGTRVYAGLIVLDLVAGPGRLGWLLTRQALDPAQFRRLKARLRLA
jgi:hypothetical protein